MESMVGIKVTMLFIYVKGGDNICRVWRKQKK